MATVIDGTPPFLENLGYASLLAEDGSPMHKSSGNMIEFSEAADKMGVDVMRWLYCAHRPENDLPFGYHRGDEVRREFLIPLWNVYSLFVTYARLDGWTPPTTGFDPDFPEGPAPQSDNLLDRWVLGRLDQVVAQVEKGVEASDFASAALAVNAFLDDLTNWYVRRSRRRFWKSEADADKQAAYATLYYILVKLARTLTEIGAVSSDTFVSFVRRAVQNSWVETCRLWDADGNEYVDYHAAFAPQLLGHDDPEVSAAVRRALDDGLSLMRCGTTPWEVELAERLRACVPSLERVQIANTGSEATAHAIRLSRAFTGREHVVLTLGGYNGWHNDVARLVMPALADVGPRVSPGEYPFLPSSAGIPEPVRRLVHVVNYNDADSVAWVLERHPVACVLTEPVLQNVSVVPPRPGYLQALRALCDRHA